MARLASTSRAKLVLIAAFAGALSWAAPAAAHTDLPSCVSAPARCEPRPSARRATSIHQAVSRLVKLPVTGPVSDLEKTAAGLLDGTVSGATEKTGKLVNGAVRDGRGLLDSTTNTLLRDPAGCKVDAALRVGACAGTDPPRQPGDGGPPEGENRAAATRGVAPPVSGASTSPDRSPPPPATRRAPRSPRVDDAVVRAQEGTPDDPGIIDVFRPFAFPLALALLVLAFLAIQGRMDSKDPKLALAPLTSDQELLSFQ